MHRQQPHQRRSRRARSSTGSAQSLRREAVIKEQYSQKALTKFIRIREEIIAKYGRNSKSRSFERPLLDARHQELRAGDFVQALTTGRNYTDRGIVSRFSKDGSRVYFIDYRRQEQNRAPENLAHIDE